MHKHLIQSNTDQEDLFINNIISIIPFITNEEEQKLNDLLPIFPILIVDNLGRFFNSNSPNATKLNLPISIDSNTASIHHAELDDDEDDLLAELQAELDEDDLLAELDADVDDLLAELDAEQAKQAGKTDQTNQTEQAELCPKTLPLQANHTNQADEIDELELEAMLRDLQNPIDISLL